MIRVTIFALRKLNVNVVIAWETPYLNNSGSRGTVDIKTATVIESIN